MILYIAEKPSLGRAIADALPKPHKKDDGCIRLANGDVVSWCIGHLLEQAEPAAYDPAFKQWRLEHLPIVPDSWKLVAKKKTRKQLSVLRGLVKQASQIVHVGDPDREGQLLVDEVISFLKVTGRKRDNIQRCLINDLNLPAVRRALNSLRNNKEFVPLSTSALARSRADWLYGINMTRLCTIQGSKAGYQGVLSVGRVQTPILGLVVRRDLEIENFVAKPYYQVWAHLVTDSNERFRAKWQPAEACLPYQDEEGRVLSRSLAENVVKRITNQPGIITDSTCQNKRQAAPLPYNLSALQIDAAKRFSMSAKQVLDTCQSLYEKHKLITYPRSDSRYLPYEHLSQASQVTQAISAVCDKLALAVTKANLAQVSKTWNDKKIQAHHAIIPTTKKTDPNRLSRDESNLYKLIARQYLIQFYPDYRYQERRIELKIANGMFKAKARQTTDAGWKVLFEKSSREIKNPPQANKNTNNKTAIEDQNQNELQKNLPNLKKGDFVQCESAELLDKLSQPAKHFNDASLLAAMTGISRFIKDPEIKKILKETDGLGTDATRAGIIELLFKRQFLQRQGKNILSTKAGQKLIASLPELATIPDMTAQWESQLSSITLKQVSYQSFIGGLQKTLNELLGSVDPKAFAGLQGKGRPLTYKKRKQPKKRSHKTD